MRMNASFDRRKGIMAIFLVVFGLAALVSGCGQSQPNTTPTGTAPGGSSLVRNDSIITGELKSVARPSHGATWELQVLINDSENVSDLVNPTKDKVGQVIIAHTDEDMTSFGAGDIITANVQLSGDVELGTSFYIHNIQLKSKGPAK